MVCEKSLIMSETEAADWRKLDRQQARDSPWTVAVERYF
jgi:hypothetical protein